MIERIYKLFNKTTPGQLLAAMVVGEFVGLGATISEEMNPMLGVIYGGSAGLLAGLFLTSAQLTFGISIILGSSYIIYRLILTKDTNVPKGRILSVTVVFLIVGILLIYKKLKNKKLPNQ